MLVAAARRRLRALNSGFLNCIRGARSRTVGIRLSAMFLCFLSGRDFFTATDRVSPNGVEAPQTPVDYRFSLPDCCLGDQVRFDERWTMWPPSFWSMSPRTAARENRDELSAITSWYRSQCRPSWSPGVASTATVRLCPRQTSGHPHTICHGWPPAAACPPKSRYTVSPFDTTVFQTRPQTRRPRSRRGSLRNWLGSHKKSLDRTHLGQRRILELDPPREGTVNQQVRAGCAAGKRAGDEDNTGCDLLSRSHPVGRVQIHCELEEFRIVRFDARPHATGVIGVSGRDGIRPNALLGELERDPRDIADDRCLHRPVRTGSEIDLATGHARNGDNRWRITLFQVRNRRRDEADRPHQIHFQ